jgi:TonB family protein
MPAAASGFDRVITLVDDMASADDPSAADLKTLASGFRDLAKSAAAPPPPPAPAPDPTPAPAGTNASVSMTAEAPVAPTSDAAKAAAPNDPMHIYGSTDSDVRPPTAIVQSLPAWNPATAGEKRTRFSGVIELIVDEDGRVVTATMRTSVQPTYDALLLKTATNWKYKPATRNGAPVKYRLHLNVQLGR